MNILVSRRTIRKWPKFNGIIWVRDPSTGILVHVALVIHGPAKKSKWEKAVDPWCELQPEMTDQRSVDKYNFILVQFKSEHPINSSSFWLNLSLGLES